MSNSINALQRSIIQAQAQAQRERQTAQVQPQRTDVNVNQSVATILSRIPNVSEPIPDRVYLEDYASGSPDAMPYAYNRSANNKFYRIENPEGNVGLFTIGQVVGQKPAVSITTYNPQKQGIEAFNTTIHILPTGDLREMESPILEQLRKAGYKVTEISPYDAFKPTTFQPTQQQLKEDKKPQKISTQIPDYEIG